MNYTGADLSLSKEGMAISLPSEEPFVARDRLDVLARSIHACILSERDTLGPRQAVSVTGSGIVPWHCYVAAESYWHLCGRAAGFQPRVASYEGITHWWLQHADGRIVDIMSAQFSLPVPYEQGRPASFLTSRPSLRTQRVMNRIDRAPRSLEAVSAAPTAASPRYLRGSRVV